MEHRREFTKQSGLCEEITEKELGFRMAVSSSLNSTYPPNATLTLTPYVQAHIT